MNFQSDNEVDNVGVKAALSMLRFYKSKSVLNSLFLISIVIFVL